MFLLKSTLPLYGNQKEACFCLSFAKMPLKPMGIFLVFASVEKKNTILFQTDDTFLLIKMLCGMNHKEVCWDLADRLLQGHVFDTHKMLQTCFYSAEHVLNYKT